MYIADEKRYDRMYYRHVGKWGLKLPPVSLGMWQNFSFTDSFENMENMCHTAFDNGIIHFDLANNYGDPYNGAAEENFGKILSRGLGKYRDELCISTKAGYDMWPGPYGSKNGSRKYLTASLDQSLKRMKLDYVDIFYHHIYDPETPLEEVALALDNAVKQGKALYVGVSNYNAQQTKEIKKIFDELKTPFIINQPSYSMLNRWIEEDGLKDFACENGLGLAVFSPLAQGMLTDKYIGTEPGASKRPWMKNQPDEQTVEKLKKLNDIAAERGQKLSQMALSWVLRDGKVTTVLIGASRPEQIVENAQAVFKTDFSDEEIKKIDEIIR
ncbi:aldo/keto reductase [Porcipelethomonas sp.]|uniref:aldo/keto reductase n=1 Tax=Porcipelethomonas sp. TaxID=2981675 RepID=UPI003EF56866